MPLSGVPATERPVVVLGAAGQLGETMVAQVSAGWRTHALTRADLDLRDSAAVYRVLTALHPWAIVNCTGYNEVDKAEDEAVAALDANAFVVRTVARAAQAIGAILVHYSSDFVFDGETDQPYTESDRPNPRSVYAASKLLGEWFAADVTTHYVLRVESLFGGLTRRKSSLDRIIDSLAAGRTARVFSDRVVSPSYAWDVADATVALLRKRPASGVYHCVNTGFATWHEVAIEIVRMLENDAPLEPITMNSMPLKASRPRYCALSNAKLRTEGISMPSWQDALGREIQRRNPTT